MIPYFTSSEKKILCHIKNTHMDLSTLTTCTDSKHMYVALVGFIVFTVVAGFAFGVLGNYHDNDAEKNATSRQLATFLLVVAALAVGWSARKGVMKFESQDMYFIGAVVGNPRDCLDRQRSDRQQRKSQCDDGNFR